MGAVQRNTLARFYHDHAADFHIIRIDLRQFSVHLDIGILRADIHHRRDRLSGLADRIALEQLTNLVKQHNGNRFRVFLHAKCAKRRHHHQEVFIKHLSVADISHRFIYNVISDDQVRHQIDDK